MPNSYQLSERTLTPHPICTCLKHISYICLLRTTISLMGKSIASEFLAELILFLIFQIYFVRLISRKKRPPKEHCPSPIVSSIWSNSRNVQILLKNMETPPNTLDLFELVFVILHFIAVIPPSHPEDLNLLGHGLFSLPWHFLPFLKPQIHMKFSNG